MTVYSGTYSGTLVTGESSFGNDTVADSGTLSLNISIDGEGDVSGTGTLTDTSVTTVAEPSQFGNFVATASGSDTEAVGGSIDTTPPGDQVISPFYTIEGLDGAESVQGSFSGNFTNSMTEITGTLDFSDDNSVAVTLFGQPALPPIISFDSGSLQINASKGTATYALTRGPVPLGDTGSSVLVSTENGTAVAGTDYDALDNEAVVFAPGQTTATVTVGIFPNSIDAAEGINPDFSVVLSDPINASIGFGTADTTIIEDGDTPKTDTISDGETGDGIDVASGDTLTVDSGGTIDDTVIAGGTVDLQAGAIVDGSLAFSGTGGTLEIAGDDMPTGMISDFGPGDTIDLTGDDGGSDGSASLGAGNVLTVAGGGTDFTLQLDPSQNYGGQSFVLTGDGSGGTDIRVQNSAPLTNELTGDGKSDLVMSDSNNGALVVDEVSGGQETYRPIGGLGPEWQFEGDGSFLGDGKDGLLIWDGNTGAMAVAEDNNGTAQYTAIGGVGSAWQFEGNGDFLGQATSDFLIWNNSSGALVVGAVANGAAQYTAIGGLGSVWQFEGVGDYLGDDKTAFLIENSSSGALVVGEDVNGSAQYTAVGGLGPQWQFEGTGDLLGHGQDDFLIWNNSTGAVVVGEVTGGSAHYTQIGAVGPEWQFLGVGDYDGASQSEFMMRDSNSGALVIGTVSGGTATYAAVGGVGSEWNFHTTHAATLS